MGLIINQKIPYGGGGGKGLEHWKEEEDKIYNSSKVTEVNPLAKIQTLDSTYGRKLYRSFDRTSITFDPNSQTSTNFARSRILSWCYPALSNDLDQPQNFDFGFDDCSANHNDRKMVTIYNYNTLSYAFCRIEDVFDRDKYYTYMFPEDYDDNVSQYNRSRIYSGLINLKVYNNSTYGDISGLRGYNEDYAFTYTWSPVKKFLCSERSNVGGYANQYASSSSGLIEMAINIQNDINNGDTKVATPIISSPYTIPGDGTIVTITIPSSTSSIRITGTASMSDGTYQDYDRDIVLTLSEITVCGNLTVQKISSTELSFRALDSEYNHDSIITTLDGEMLDPTCQLIYNLAQYYRGYIGSDKDTYDFRDEVYEIMVDSEYAVGQKEAGLYNHGQYNDINFPYANQSLWDATQSLVRNHSSDYVNVDKTIPFVFTAVCLGRLHEYKPESYYDNTEPYNFVKDYEDVSKPISGFSYYETIPYVGEFSHNKDDFNIRDHDLDDNNSDLVIECAYRDRTLAQHGIFMGDDDVAWYVFLAPYEKIDDDDGGSPYSITPERDLAYLNMDETPNHWAYYNGANPVDETKTYTNTHKNGMTFTINVTSLSEESEKTYHNNFINLAKKIVDKLGVKGIKPYFDTAPIKTSLCVDSMDGTAFSSGYVTDTESYVERVNINGKTGRITSLGSIEAGESVFEGGLSLKEKYQEKLIAGENITIEGNVISASGGGGSTHEYINTPQIVGTWMGRPLYEISQEISNTTTSQFIIKTGIEVPSGKTASDVKIINIDGAIKTTSGWYMPIPYYYTSSSYIYYSSRGEANSTNGTIDIRVSFSKGSSSASYAYSFTVLFTLY